MSATDHPRCACGREGRWYPEGAFITLECTNCGNRISFPKSWFNNTILPDGWEDLESKIDEIIPGRSKMFHRADDRMITTDCREIIDSVVSGGAFKHGESYKGAMYYNCSTHGQSANKTDYAFALTLTIHDSEYAQLTDLAEICVRNGWGETLVASLLECGAYDADIGKQKPVEVELAFLHNNDADNSFFWDGN